MRYWMAGLAAIGAAAGPTAAQEACAVPPALSTFARPVVLLPRASLQLGTAMRASLSTDAKLPVAPGKPPAAGSYRGAFVFTVAKAGRYRVAIDQPAWIDVASKTHLLASAAHGHAPACSGARKMVDYDLKPGVHVLQLSGAAAPAATILVAAL